MWQRRERYIKTLKPHWTRWDRHALCIDLFGKGFVPILHVHVALKHLASMVIAPGVVQRE